MVAALARVMDVTVLTADRGFEAVPDLRIENWLHRFSVLRRSRKPARFDKIFRAADLASSNGTDLARMN
jgi:hypothetical protein